MLKISMFEFLIRGVPEAFLFIFAAYAFSKVKIDYKRYFISAILLSVAACMIRFLPIQYGVNTILDISVFIILIVNVNRIEIITSIKSVILTIIIEYVCEGINVLIIQVIFKIDMNYIFSNSRLKAIYGIPSLIIFGIVLLFYYTSLKKRKELRGIKNGKIEL